MLFLIWMEIFQFLDIDLLSALMVYLLTTQPADFPQLTWGGHFTGKLCRKLDATKLCSNLPHVTSQCNVARDWVRYAPFCFCCDSRGRKWGPQHHRFITGPPTPPTKRHNGDPSLTYLDDMPGSMILWDPSLQDKLQVTSAPFFPAASSLPRKKPTTYDTRWATCRINLSLVNIWL